MIFGKDLAGVILRADTKEKAQKLADTLAEDYKSFGHICFNNGKSAGKEEVKNQITYLLDIKECDHSCQEE